MIERERDREEIIRRDREEKETEEEHREIEEKSKRKEMPKIIKDVTLTRAWEEDRPILPIGSRILYQKQEKLVAKMDAVSEKSLSHTKTRGVVEDTGKSYDKGQLDDGKYGRSFDLENGIQTVKELDIELKKKKSNETTICSAEKDRSLKTIRSAIELELSSQRLHIRREYKLTQKSNFDLWMDYLKSELMNNDLLDIIDSNIKSPENLSELKLAKRKSLVRDIIINHLDENCHKRILHEKDPTEILKKLRGYKKSEINVTHASVRSRLYQIRMRKDEKAVSLNVPELRHVDLIRRQTNLKEMNIDEIKSFMMQLEAEIKNESREKPEKMEVRAQRATAEEDIRQVKCFRCNRMGHMAKNCPLAESGAWFCYYCQEVRGHKGDSCPNAGAQANKPRGKRYLNKTVNTNIKKKGKFEQRGTKRVNNKGKITKIQKAKKPTPTKTTKEVLEGIYEEPNWIIQFEVKNNNVEDNDNVECVVYRCRADIVSHCELPEQSQANIQNNELSISEGELEKKDNDGSAIGRENEGELTNVSEDTEHNNTELEQVIKLEDIQTIENIEEMFESSVTEKIVRDSFLNLGQFVTGVMAASAGSDRAAPHERCLRMLDLDTRRRCDFTCVTGAFGSWLPYIVHASCSAKNFRVLLWTFSSETRLSAVT
ncbi:PREDICTED: uncharacterized protein LOC105556037 [Vollenhovia emeryi]|uniref:uncharacterized protein LOC105556037 n=1 Tax=Vollenhovia emeryi TaxID=411798 RepID=UPI0005F40721|nr:PREDICTED: uncharacterized protein LOC105556037 [Vollenhovia emeryi]